MIGNLGRVAYSPISHNDENNGNGGNTPHEPAQILNQQNESVFPWHKNSPGTVGTRGESSTPVPDVPECLVVTGNNSDNKNIDEKQPVIKSVPVVPAVPVKNRVATDKLPMTKPCYCCKGTDYWLGGTEKYPHRVCRKCHPPAPGTERKPDKTLL